MKKKITNICAIILTSILIVITLYGFSIKDIYFEDNGFNRDIILIEDNMIEKIPLEMKISEVIEVTDNGAYLVNEGRTDIYYYNFKTKNSTSLNYSELLNTLKLPNYHQIELDNNNVLITSPINRQLYIIKLSEIQSNKSYDSIELKYGADKIGISKSKYLVKGRDSLYNALYYTIDKNTLEKNIPCNNIIETSRVGLIKDDGLFTDSDNYSVYAKYHKNEYFIIDNEGESSKKLSTVNTNLDSINVHQDKNGVVTIMGEVEYNNMRASIDKDKLFIQSGVKADNEEAFRFKFNSIIDVYQIENSNKYLYSFYIPSYSGVKMNSYKVYDDVLYAIHGNFLITYKINQ